MFRLLRVIFGLSWICFFPTSLCGVLVLDCALLSAPLASCLPPTRTQPHNLLTHNLLTHNLLTHTQLTHTQVIHTHTTYSQLTHTHTTHTHTHAHSLLTHNSHTHSSPTHNSPAHKLSLCVAGVFLVTSSFTLCGKRGTDGAGLALVARLVPVCRRGRRGSLCVAGLALGDVDLQFVWQVWRLWCWAGSGGALGSRLSPRTRRLFVWQAWHLEASASILCGRRGAWQHRPSLCVAGVALMALGWLWWRAWLQLFLEESTSILCGRPGAWRHRPSLCVTSVALMVLR